MTVKKNIYFFPQKQAGRDDARLKCRVTWGGNLLSFGLGHRVDPQKWSAEAQRCVPRSTHGKMNTPAAIINRDIEETLHAIAGSFWKYEEAGENPSKDDIKKELVEIGIIEGKAADESIFPIFDIYLSEGERLGKWTPATVKKLQTIKNHLKGVSPDLTFKDLDENGTEKVISYLTSKRGRTMQGSPDTGKDPEGLANHTVNKDVSLMRTFVRWAIEKGYCKQCSFITQKTRLKTTQKTVVFLKWDELMRIYSHDFSMRPTLESVRDVFCFCCFTSLRYSDVANLKKSDISNESISIVTQKTNDRITIEFNKYSKAIWERYRDLDFAGGKALPIVSNQKMNDRLKTIGEICEINEPVTYVRYRGAKRIEETYQKWQVLSSHVARRTFICNALALGISPNVIMKWTGHSDYKAMKPYIDIADEVRRDAMGIFDRL